MLYISNERVIFILICNRVQYSAATHHSVYFNSHRDPPNYYYYYCNFSLLLDWPPYQIDVKQYRTAVL